MPIKIPVDLKSLPTVLNKWASEIEQRLNYVEGSATKADRGNFTVSQVTRKNLIDASTSIFKLQSTLPVLSGSFTYTSTSNSVTWFWNSLVLYYPNGVTKSLPNGSNTVTGLSASTTYYFYPYYSLDRNKLEYVPGGVGTPDIAFTARSLGAAQQQTLDNNAPLSGGAVPAVTGASGGGTGGGGGGGSDCLRAGTEVMVKDVGLTPVEDILIGDWILAPQGWTQVVNAQVNRQASFLRVWLEDGTVLETSHTHPIAVLDAPEGYKLAEELCLQDKVSSRKNPLAVRGVQLIPTHSRFYLFQCEPYHEYYFSPAYVETHNSIIAK
jgi:hypothetical protein